MSDSLLTEPPYAYLFWALLVAWLALNLRLHFRGREGVRRESSGSRLVLGLSSAVGIFGAILAYRAAPWAAIPAPRLAFWLAVGFLVIGVAIREYAVRTLGRYFTLDLAAAEEQEVVDAGPYAWVRHPGYTGAAISFLGFGLVLANWLSLAVVTVLVGAGYAYRIRIEERLLREELGDPYRAYTEEVPYRLVPGLW